MNRQVDETALTLEIQDMLADGTGKSKEGRTKVNLGQGAQTI